jgi:hypothetical protein
MTGYRRILAPMRINDDRVVHKYSHPAHIQMFFRPEFTIFEA